MVQIPTLNINSKHITATLGIDWRIPSYHRSLSKTRKYE